MSTHDVPCGIHQMIIHWFSFSVYSGYFESLCGKIAFLLLFAKERFITGFWGKLKKINNISSKFDNKASKFDFDYFLDNIEIPLVGIHKLPQRPISSKTEKTLPKPNP